MFLNVLVEDTKDYQTDQQHSRFWTIYFGEILRTPRMVNEFDWLNQVLVLTVDAVLVLGVVFLKWIVDFWRFTSPASSGSGCSQSEFSSAEDGQVFLIYIRLKTVKNVFNSLNFIFDIYIRFN